MNPTHQRRRFSSPTPGNSFRIVRPAHRLTDFGSEPGRCTPRGPVAPGCASTLWSPRDAGIAFSSLRSSCPRRSPRGDRCSPCRHRDAGRPPAVCRSRCGADRELLRRRQLHQSRPGADRQHGELRLGHGLAGRGCAGRGVQRAVDGPDRRPGGRDVYADGRVRRQHQGRHRHDDRDRRFVVPRAADQERLVHLRRGDLLRHQD